MLLSVRKYLLWFWKASRGCRLSIFVLSFASIASVGISLLFVFVCKRLIDIATRVYDGSMMYYTIFLILVIFSSILLAAYRNRITSLTGVLLQNTIRRSLFEKLMYVCHGGRHQRHTGDVVNRMEEDTQVVKNALGNILPSILSTSIQFLASFSFLLYLDSRLAWIVVVVMPVSLVASKLFIVRVRKLTHAIRSKDGEIQSHLMESVQHTTLLQTLEQEDRTIHRLNQMHGELYNRVLSLTRFSVLSSAIVSGAFAIGYLIAFLWGVHGIYAGTVSFGMMTAFLQLVGQIQRPLVDMSHQVPAIIHATASADRLMELEGDELEEIKSPTFLHGTAGMKLDNVSFAYPDTTRNILLHFSYDFKPGSRTAILGETGAGKSTLIRLMLSLLRQQEGDITIYDDKVAIKADASVRCNMVYVPQGNSLLSGTIRDNLLLGNPDATDAQMKEALHMAAAEFVDDLPDGIDTQCAELGAGLSEGQAQRIAIARALLRKGSIMLLDEFSSSLDDETEKRLIDNLMHKLPQRTMIFITHRKKITEFCTDLIEIKKQ